MYVLWIISSKQSDAIRRSPWTTDLRRYFCGNTLLNKHNNRKNKAKFVLTSYGCGDLADNINLQKLCINKIALPLKNFYHISVVLYLLMSYNFLLEINY